MHEYVSISCLSPCPQTCRLSTVTGMGCTRSVADPACISAIYRILTTRTDGGMPIVTSQTGDHCVTDLQYTLQTGTCHPVTSDTWERFGVGGGGVGGLLYGGGTASD